MDKHYGQIVELTIRKKGFSISELARLAEINRKCVYNWFNQKYLKPEIIHRIGGYINHDFSVEFPELFTADDFIKPLDEPLDPTTGKVEGSPMWKDRYINLLEKYNNLLLEQYNKSSE